MSDTSLNYIVLYRSIRTTLLNSDFNKSAVNRSFKQHYTSTPHTTPQYIISQNTVPHHTTLHHIATYQHIAQYTAIHDTKTLTQSAPPTHPAVPLCCSHQDPLLASTAHASNFNPNVRKARHSAYTPESL